MKAKYFFLFLIDLMFVQNNNDNGGLGEKDEEINKQTKIIMATMYMVI